MPARRPTRSTLAARRPLAASRCSGRGAKVCPAFLPCAGPRDAGDLRLVPCFERRRRHRLAPHDPIDRYRPCAALEALVARDMRCKRHGRREVAFELRRVTHPAPGPPPTTIRPRIAREFGVTEGDLRRRRPGDARSGAPSFTPAS